jgi:hypothetical protein
MLLSHKRFTTVALAACRSKIGFFAGLDRLRPNSILAASTAGPASVKAAEPQGTNDQFFIGLDGWPSCPVQV